MPYRHPAMAIALTIVYLTLFTAGEALHLLPGMGHFVETPSGNCLWIGGSCEQDPLPWHDDGGPVLKAVGVGLGQVLDTDECEICSLLALVAQLLVFAGMLATEILLGKSSILLPARAMLLSRAPYTARAPPRFF